MTGVGVDEADLCAYCAATLIHTRRFLGADALTVTDFDGSAMETRDWSLDSFVESVQLGYRVETDTGSWVSKAATTLDGSRVCCYHAWYLTKDDARR